MTYNSLSDENQQLLAIPKVKSISLNKNALIVETIRNKNVLNSKLFEKNIKDYILASEQRDNKFYNELLFINNQKFFLKKQFWIQSLLSDVNNKINYNLNNNNLGYNILNYNNIKLTKNERALLNYTYNSRFSKNKSNEALNYIFNLINGYINKDKTSFLSFNDRKKIINYINRDVVDLKNFYTTEKNSINKHNLFSNLNHNIILHNLHGLNKQVKMNLVSTEYNNSNQFLNQNDYFNVNENKLINIKNKDIPEEILSQIDKRQVELKELKVNVTKNLATLENIKTDFIENKILLTRFEKHVSSNNVINISKDDLPKPRFIKKKIIENKVLNNNVYTEKYNDYIKENVYKLKNLEESIVKSINVLEYKDENYDNKKFHINKIVKHSKNKNVISLKNIEKIKDDKLNKELITFENISIISNKNLDLLNKNTIQKKLINLSEIDFYDKKFEDRNSTKKHENTLKLNFEYKIINDRIKLNNIINLKDKTNFSGKQDGVINNLIVQNNLLKKNNLVNLEKTTENDTLLKEYVEEKYNVKTTKAEKVINNLIVQNNLLKKNSLINLENTTENDTLLKEYIEEKYNVKATKAEKVINNLIVQNNLLKKNSLINLEKTTENDTLLKEYIEEKYNVKATKAEKVINNLIVQNNLLKKNSLINLEKTTENDTLLKEYVEEKYNVKTTKAEKAINNLIVQNNLLKKNNLINLENTTENDTLLKEYIEEKYNVKTTKADKVINNLIVQNNLLKKNSLINLENTTENDTLLKEYIEEKYNVKATKAEKVINNLIVQNNLLKKNNLVNLEKTTENNLLKRINEIVDSQIITADKNSPIVNRNFIKPIIYKEQEIQETERKILEKEKHINLVSLNEKVKKIIVKYNKSKDIINKKDKKQNLEKIINYDSKEEFIYSINNLNFENSINEDLYLLDNLNKKISTYKSIFTAKFNSIKKTTQILKGIKATSRNLTFKNNKITDLNDILEDVSILSKLEKVHLTTEKLDKKYKLNKNKSTDFEVYKHLDNKIDYENVDEFSNEVMLYEVEEKGDDSNFKQVSKMVYKKPIIIDNSVNSENENSLNSQENNGQDVFENQVDKELESSFSQQNQNYEEYTKKIQSDVDQKIEIKTKELIMEYMSDLDVEDISKKVLKNVENILELQKRRYGIRS